MDEKSVRPNSFDAGPAPASYQRYIEQGRLLAQNAGVTWEMKIDACGVASTETAWDLRALLQDGNPAQAKLRTFSTVPKIISTMIEQGLRPSDTNIEPRAISEEWQNFIKAYAINHLLVAGMSVQHLNSVCAALRTIATIVHDKVPWHVDSDDLNRTISVMKVAQPSAQSVVVLVSFIKKTVDGYYLFYSCPLYPSIAGNRTTVSGNYRAAGFTKKEDSLKKTLLERKSQEKLPEVRAFWEFMRIVFTEKPRTFVDAIRFAQGKILAITGLRIGEIAFLPHDWKRIIDYRDRDGIAAGAHGGFSNALLLRYFAEKQGSSRREVGTFWETTQFVPEMFREILTETLEEVERLTAPLRKTLRAQCETGRLMPMYPLDAILPVPELYVHLTGMALFREIPETVVQAFFEQYRACLDADVLEKLVRLQSKNSANPRMALYQFAIRLRKQGIGFLNADGTPWIGSKGPVNQYLRVSEVETFIREKTPTKVSDTTPFRVEGGLQIQSSEMLFLVPKRAIGEGRDQSPCHVGRTIAVGIATPELLAGSLSAADNESPTLFQTYGLNDEDRALSLLPHSLRHLQNTELFRLGVADTIITKRFNRRSVAQSYEYDHRSLQEELEQITLADEWEVYLGPKASVVAKLIESGRANGPIVKEFLRLKKEEGDESAYGFLKAEADGFHATPYGHCLNSFTVDPCPTHLECFNGCGHLSATDLPENRKHLIILHGKLKDALEAARAKPARSIGRDNQIHHAEVRLKNVAQLLETPAGERVFPGGIDLSKQSVRRSIFDGT
jgi:hypothetical protein